MDTLQNIPTATPESVWAMFQETDRMFQKSAERHEELDRMFQETRLLLQELAQSQKETDRKMQENARQIKEVNQTVGGMGNSHGAFAEEYFFNSFENGKRNFFGERFDEIAKNLKTKTKTLQGEYDIVLYNHEAVAIIEVKYKARVDDIPSILKKADTFRILFPDYKDFKVYLALASMSFYPELENACISAGIAIIKQVGETVVICDGHLKTF